MSPPDCGRPAIETPASYEDMPNILDWACPFARMDWHQEMNEWRLTIPKISDLATQVRLTEETP